MSDRYNALVVALEKDVRDDDADFIINAIKMIKGVKAVQGNISNVNSFVIESRLKDKLSKELYDVIDRINKLSSDMV